MNLVDETIDQIQRGDDAAAEATQRLLDAKTKPVGSLGRLETLACRLAAIRREVPDHVLSPAIVVAAADHGVALEGVSAYPREVTRQMLANFATGGAAVSVLARDAGARLVVVDCGVDLGGGDAVPGVVDAVVDGIRGTEDFTLAPATSRSTAVAMIERGIALTADLVADGIELVALGEMGIGNTTSAGAIVAALTGADPAEVCGPGTGVDHRGIERKVEVVTAALERHGLPRSGVDAIDVLASVGGLEIAFLVGVTLGAAARRVPVLLDGFITGAVALVAAGIAPSSVDAMVATTRSPEPGHDVALRALGLEPLLDLGLRLGEGTGAALALSLVRAASTLLAEMATFEGAGVSEREDRRALSGA